MPIDGLTASAIITSSHSGASWLSHAQITVCLSRYILETDEEMASKGLFWVSEVKMMAMWLLAKCFSLLGMLSRCQILSFTAAAVSIRAVSLAARMNVVQKFHFVSLFHGSLPRRHSLYLCPLAHIDKGLLHRQFFLHLLECGMFTDWLNDSITVEKCEFMACFDSCCFKFMKQSFFNFLRYPKSRKNPSRN